MNANVAPETLSAIAQHCMRAAKNDRDAAARALFDRITSDATLQAEALHIAVTQLLAGVATYNRCRNIRAVATRTDSDARVREVMHTSFLATWMIGAIPLGKAMPEDLRRSIGMRRANAQTEAKRAEFEAAILKCLKNGKRVEQCLSEDQVAEIAAKVGLQ